MFADSAFSEPVSSYQFPVDIPNSSPGDSPLETVCVNTDWLALLRGCAKQLLLQSTWRTSDPGELAIAQGKAFDLIDLLQDSDCGGSMSVPIGVFMPFGGSVAPDTWLLCDGSAVSRSTYADLFAVIGTTFGSGNGTTTFNVPDMRGKFPLGVSTSPSHPEGSTGGSETHTLDVAELPAHHHREQAAGSNGQSPTTMSYKTGSGALGTGVLVKTDFASATFADLNTVDTGSGTAHSILNPYLAANYIIFAGV